jgi:hypothetical protein
MNGWKLVPVEPTNKMAIAGAAIWGFVPEKAVPVYKAMLAAAPSPPADPRDDYYDKPCHSDPGRARPANAAALAEKDAEIERLKAALRAIVEMQDKTLLGGADCRNEEHAHQVGANKAFQQCADMASQALRGDSHD